MSALNFHNIFIFPNFIKSLSYMFLATRQIVHSFSGENNYTYVSLVVKGNYVKRSKSVKIYFVTDCSFKLFWRLNQFSGLALTNWNLLFFLLYSFMTEFPIILKQSIDLLCNCSLYDRDLRHERVKAWFLIYYLYFCILLVVFLLLVWPYPSKVYWPWLMKIE